MKICFSKFIFNKNWVIVLSSFFGHFIIYGTTWSIGIFANIFRNALREDNVVVLTWIGTINTATVYASCPLGNMIMNRIGYRYTTVIGGVLAVTGLFISAFSSQVYEIIICFSFITGVGLGIAFIPVISIVSSYFTTKRNLAVGIAVSGVGMGTFVYPSMLELLMEHYGWRSTLLVLSGLTMHIFVIAATFNVKICQNKCSNKKSKISGNQRHHGSILIISTNISYVVRNISQYLFRLSLPFKALISFLNSFKWKKISKTLHFSLFKSPDFLVLGLNNIFIHSSLSIIFLFLGRYSECIGYSSWQNSLLMSIIGISNLLGRIGFGLITIHPRMEIIGNYSLSLGTLGIIVWCICLTEEYIVISIIASFIGLLSAPAGCLLPGVVIKIVGIEHFSYAYSYLMLFEAIGFLIGGPIAGSIYSVSKSIISCFLLSGSLFIFGSAIMFFPWKSKIWTHQKNKINYV